MYKENWIFLRFDRICWCDRKQISAFHDTEAQFSLCSSSTSGLKLTASPAGSLYGFQTDEPGPFTSIYWSQVTSESGQTEANLNTMTLL